MHPSSVLAFFVISCVICLEFPPFIQRCKYSQLRYCGPDSGNAAIPTILKGHPTYGISFGLPLALGDMVIDQPNLKVSLKNCELYGLETTHIYDLTLENASGRIGLIIDRLSLTGQYLPGTKIFESTLHTGGVANFTLLHGVYDLEYPVVFEAENEDKTRDVHPYRFFWNVQPNHTIYSFYGNEADAPFLIIENSKVINAIVFPMFRSALTSAYQATLGPILKKFPVEHFFLPES